MIAYALTDTVYDPVEKESHGKDGLTDLLYAYSTVVWIADGALIQDTNTNTQIRIAVDKPKLDWFDCNSIPRRSFFLRVALALNSPILFV